MYKKYFPSNFRKFFKIQIWLNWQVNRSINFGAFWSHHLRKLDLCGNVWFSRWLIHFEYGDIGLIKGVVGVTAHVFGRSNTNECSYVLIEAFLLDFLFVLFLNWLELIVKAGVNHVVLIEIAKLWKWCTAEDALVRLLLSMNSHVV